MIGVFGRVALDAVGAITRAGTAPGPPFTEVVRVRTGPDSGSWPPVLVFCVAVVVLGGLTASIVFLRRAHEAARQGNARDRDG